MNDFNRHTFTNKIDHFNKTDTRTYEQRYWMNQMYWDPKNGPILVYICGEWSCTPPDTKMFPFMVGAEHKAALISIEHRYYGKSQPFEDWSTENLRYLTSE